jgi:3-methyl-2-oxobutanoate hydroxymethyltransferase
MAGLLELSGAVDAILVGDSLGMVFQGKNSTREVTVEQMAYHTAAVRRGAAKSFIITDMPFGSDLDPTEALANAQELLEAGADAVKIEGRKLPGHPHPSGATDPCDGPFRTPSPDSRVIHRARKEPTKKLRI